MKKLFRIGSGLFVYSIIPILTWIVLSHILGDNRIANVFSITYAIQYIQQILKCHFGSGANIRKEKEKNSNSVWNSIFWGTIFTSIIFAILLIFVDNYIIFMGQEVEFYRNYIIYGISLLFLQTLFSLIMEKLYFEDKEKLATIHLTAFNLTSFVVFILSVLIFPNTLIALLITIGVLLIYVICLYVWQFEKFKINFSFFKNFKYESANIVSSTFLLITYLFGYKIAFSAGPEYLLALNIICMCTDTQWDMLNAVSIVAKVDISKNRYEYKKSLKNAYIYTCVVVATSISMSLIVSIINDVVLHIALIYLVFQVINMLLYPYITILSTYTQLEYSATLNTIINLTTKGLRTLLSVFVISPFCTEIGQITATVIAFVVFAIIRATKYKIEDKQLIVKRKNKI